MMRARANLNAVTIGLSPLPRLSCVLLALNLCASLRRCSGSAAATTPIKMASAAMIANARLAPFPQTCRNSAPKTLGDHREAMDAFRRIFKPDEYRDEQSEARGRPGCAAAQ